jgi:osmoprotectant transport system ATP-binding protein
MIALDNVSKTYGARVALHPLTLELQPRRTTVLIGPSGCGKSTLLRMIVGLVQPDTGSVSVDGAMITPHTVERVRRGLGYVIQEGGLFPHLTARENVTLLARFLGASPEALETRLGLLRELTGLSSDALMRYPQQLSGGQRQRVALMRALMLDPPVLLLDEPLGALDPVTRFELQTELKSIFGRLQKTVVLVTHDMGEAAYFADELVMLWEGRVIQRGAPGEFLERPANDYVHAFVRAQRTLVPSAPA